VNPTIEKVVHGDAGATNNNEDRGFSKSLQENAQKRRTGILGRRVVI
jgi:hypothetical protein